MSCPGARASPSPCSTGWDCSAWAPWRWNAGTSPTSSPSSSPWRSRKAWAARWPGGGAHPPPSSRPTSPRECSRSRWACPPSTRTPRSCARGRWWGSRRGRRGGGAGRGARRRGGRVGGLAGGLAGRGLGAGALQAVAVGLLYLALGATWIPSSGRALLDAGLLVSFVLVERASVAHAARPPRALQPLCALGAGLAGVWLLGEVMPGELTTLAWGVAASGLFVLGFAVRERWYRLAGLGVLALTLGRLMFVDLSGLPPDQRILTFLMLGVMLLAVSYIYTRVRGQRS